MKSFLTKILLLLFPVFTLVIVFPVDERQKYVDVKGDCSSQGIWLHDRVFVNEKPIDVAFMGSSHTMNSINDVLLDSLLPNHSVANLGYCRFGRNLHHLFLKNLLAHKKPKVLVLEVRKQEDRYSHPMYPYLASSSEVVFPKMIVNKNYFDDVWTHLSFKTNLIQEDLFSSGEEVPHRLRDHGYFSIPDTVARDELEKIKGERNRIKRKHTGFEDFFHNNYPRAYLSEIHEMCESNDIQLFFLYLPSYGHPYLLPNDTEYYEQYGKLLMPPQAYLENPDFWYDVNHTNEVGARTITKWVANDLKDYLF